MPKPDDRGSLMNLRTTLPQIAPIEPSEEMTHRIMGNPPSSVEAPPENGGPTTIEIGTHRVRRQIEPSRLRASRREGTVLLNAKIPTSVHIRLKRTSQYNDVSMTDILLKGIQAELDSGRYSLPPQKWGRDQDDLLD